MITEKNTPKYIITCGDEGVQINEGRRLAFVGAGYHLDGFSNVVKILKKLLKSKIRIAASEENDWILHKANLEDHEQADATMQQQIQALADQEDLIYSGFLTFTDPKELKLGIRGHMVRPRKIHIANKICFTLGGGELEYNLGCFVICADWVAQASLGLVKKVILPQIEFYEKLAGRKLEYHFQSQGELDEQIAEKNKKVLEKLGLNFVK